MTAIILDTETTGLTAKDQVIELAYYEASTLENEKNTRAWEVLKDSIWNYRYHPSVPINPYANAVHGIYLTDLKNKPMSKTVALPANITYIIGHNIVFDKRMLLQSNPNLTEQLNSIKYICTMGLAKTLTKFLKIPYENHKLDTLVKYYYPEDTSLTTPLHNASNDVLKTILVLLKLVEHIPNVKTWEDIYNFQQRLVR